MIKGEKVEIKILKVLSSHAFAKAEKSIVYQNLEKKRIVILFQNVVVVR